MWIKYLYELFVFGLFVLVKIDVVNSYFVCYLVLIVIKVFDFRNW